MAYCSTVELSFTYVDDEGETHHDWTTCKVNDDYAEVGDSYLTGEGIEFESFEVGEALPYGE